MLKISYIPKNSIAYRAGLRKDDIILLFNDEKAQDMLDVAFFDSQSKFSVTVEREGGQMTFFVAKSVTHSLELDFYDQCYIEPTWCHNKCIFCFVDQLPKRQRPTLYVKDDDWRLSFVSGNYVTLTDLSQDDIDRICKKRFSPLYVSVHATDDNVRRKMLGNSKAADILPLLKKFCENGITIHTQVVLVAGWNDGEVLKKTLSDLAQLYPSVNTLAIVPVGLTKFREKLASIAPISREVAQATVKTVEEFDKTMFEKYGEHFVYCSDEMYVFAELDIPDYSYYGDFSQIENGVGLVADLRYQFNLAYADVVAPKPCKFTIVTGVSAQPFLSELLNKAKSDFPTLSANIVAVKNTFFGETVTVAGLVVGADIVSTLKNAQDVGDILLLPRVMLRESEDVFLDGMTLGELQQLTKRKVVVLSDGFELCQELFEVEYE